MFRSILSALLVILAVGGSNFSHGANNKRTGKNKPPQKETSAEKEEMNGVAEARLIEIYKLIGLAQNREALAKADQLVGSLAVFTSNLNKKGTLATN